MGDFESQGCVNTAWAFTRADQNDASLFAALATAAERCLGYFNSQNLANTAWAFAKICTIRPKLMQKFGEAAFLQKAQFNPEDLLRFLWAYEQAGTKGESVAKAVVRQSAHKYAFPS